MSAVASSDPDAITCHMEATSAARQTCSYLQPCRFPDEFVVEARGLEPPTLALRSLSP